MTKGLASAKDFSDIANAIRAINGLDVRYKPREMADAIRGLGQELEAGPKAVLYDDGTLEFTNKAVPLYLGKGGVEEHYDLSVETYRPENLPPWNGLGERVERVAIDSSFEQVEVTALDYWFFGLTGLREISGFDHLAHLASANHAFDGCESLETIYAAPGFALSEIPAEDIFKGAQLIVGGLRHVVTEDDGAAQLVHGEEGLLTDPENDTRHWIYMHRHEDGELVMTMEETPRGDSLCVVSQHQCIDANYSLSTKFKYRDDAPESIQRLTFDASLDGLEADISLDGICMGCSNLATITGFEHLHRVTSAFNAFAFCTSLVEVNLCGLDPSALGHLENLFFNCSSLTTIYADPTWELPETAYGTGVFYQDRNLRGGAGSGYEETPVDIQYFRIDGQGGKGYLTAKQSDGES